MQQQNGGRACPEEMQQYKCCDNADCSVTLKNTCSDKTANQGRECLECLLGGRSFQDCAKHSLFHSDCNAQSDTCKRCLERQGSNRLVRASDNPCKRECNCPYPVSRTGIFGDYFSCCSEPVVDCVLGEWTQWTQCGVVQSGKETRSRRVNQSPKYLGEPCGPTMETRSCGQNFCVDNGFQSAFDCGTCVLKDFPSQSC